MKTKFTGNNLTSHKILFSRNAEKTHIDQSIPLVSFTRKRKNPHKPSKIEAAKKVFPSVYVIGIYNLPQLKFFIPCVSWKTLLFIKVYR